MVTYGMTKIKDITGLILEHRGLVMLKDVEEFTDEDYLMIEIDILARTMWGEGRVGNTEGIEAIGHLVLNRAKNPCWWGQDVISVCQKPYQFECWNRSDSYTYKRLISIDDGIIWFDVAKREAMRLMLQEMQGKRKDFTGGATHHVVRRRDRQPIWAMQEKPTCMVGPLMFYNLGKDQ